MECFIFPLLQTNLFPQTTKPVLVSDPQSVFMIQDSIDQKIPIALAYVPENGDTYRSIAGYGYPQVIEQKPDGSMLVFFVGLGKVKLTQNTVAPDRVALSESHSAGSTLKSFAHGRSPHLISIVEKINEDLTLHEDLKSKYMTLSHLLVSWVQKHIKDPQQREVFIRNLSGPQEIIGSFAAYLIRDYDLQYEMMEIYSLNEQIEYLYRLFESNELTN